MQPKIEVTEDVIIITLPRQTPTPSASGKTLVIASTRGNVRTDEMVDGRPVTVGANVYIPAAKK